MMEIFGSKVKVEILLYLGTRGGCSGRHLSRILKISSSQIFKALRQMVEGRILKKYGKSLYALNPNYTYYAELMSLIQKEADLQKNRTDRYLPIVAKERRVDPISVYRFADLRGQKLSVPRLSDVLRERYG